MDRTTHWENVYETKEPNQVSWTQNIPKTSLDFIHSFNLPKEAGIIDIGGGDSKLVDFLLEEGFMDITVLDISSKALERAKLRLGKKADKIQWIVSDITEFKPTRNYDLWHDRAAFHFLTTPEQKDKYVEIVQKSVNGYLVLGTFSENGPKKCSGLDIAQYSEETLSELLKNRFEKIKCLTEDHTTPFNTTQNFLFCSFKKKILKMKDEEEFEKAILSFSDKIRDIARQTRKLIHNVLPEVVEVVWVKQKNIGFGTGPKKNTEHFCWLMPASKHVTLGFNYGAELPDPNNILEGNGKLFRHFKVKSIEDLSNPDLIDLLKYATTYRVPNISK